MWENLLQADLSSGADQIRSVFRGHALTLEVGGACQSYISFWVHHVCSNLTYEKLEYLSLVGSTPSFFLKQKSSSTAADSEI